MQQISAAWECCWKCRVWIHEMAVRKLIGDEMVSSGLHEWKDTFKRWMLRIMMGILSWTRRKLWGICVYGHPMEWMIDYCSFWSIVCSFVVVVMWNVMSMRWCVYVHVMLFASGKDRVSQYVIIIMDCCPSWTLLSDTRSGREVTRYIYSLCISHHGLSPPKWRQMNVQLEVFLDPDYRAE